MAGTEVGSLYYDLNIDDKKLKSQLDGAEKHVKSFGDKLNKHWNNSVNASKKILVGLTVATGAAVAFGVSSVKSFMESEKSQAALVNTLKSTNNASGQTLKGMNKLAAQLQSTTGFTDEFVGSAQNMLLTFTKVGKEVFPEATRATLDMARQFGGDAQQNAIRLGKALQDPIAGVGALSKIGVQFSAVQQEQIQNFMKAGDIMSAQKVILGEIATQTKGAAEAYGKTFAGQIDILKASFDDLKEGLGQLMVSGLKPLTAMFSKWVKSVNDAGGFLEYFRGIIKRNKNMLELLAGVIIGALVPAIAAMVFQFAQFLVAISPWSAAGAGVVIILRKLGVNLEDAANAAVWLVDRFTILKDWLISLKEPVVLLVEQLKELWSWFTDLDPAIQALIFPIGFLVANFGMVKQAVMDLVNVFMTWFWPSIKAVATTLVQNLLPALQQIWTSVIKLLSALSPALVQILKLVAMIIGVSLVASLWIAINALNVIIKAFSIVIGIIANVIGWVANLINWFGSFSIAVARSVQVAVSWLGKLPGNVADVVGRIVGWFKTLPSKIGGAVSGVTDALTAPFKAAFNAIAKFWNDTVGKLDFRAPDWVPGLGGKGWSMPQLPILDTGGIISKPTIAMLAANSKPEVVIPLEKLGGMGTTINIGTINDRQDADYLLRRLDRNSFLESNGLTPVGGGSAA